MQAYEMSLRFIYLYNQKIFTNSKGGQSITYT